MPSPMPLKDPTLFTECVLVGGNWVSAGSDEARIPVVNPADDTTIGHVPDLGAAQVDRAIAAADAARPS